MVTPTVLILIFFRILAITGTISLLIGLVVLWNIKDKIKNINLNLGIGTLILTVYIFSILTWFI